MGEAFDICIYPSRSGAWLASVRVRGLYLTCGAAEFRSPVPAARWGACLAQCVLGDPGGTVESWQEAAEASAIDVTSPSGSGGAVA